ncbi:ADP-ribose pyrophosphatase, partial [Rhodococcus jostii]
MTDTGRHEFETLDSRAVYSGAILALRVDHVAMPDGRTAEREVVGPPRAGGGGGGDDQDPGGQIPHEPPPGGGRVWGRPAGPGDG